MKDPLVSIIINNYNYRDYVGDAIDSALRQTYKQIEVIVVDDGSTDDSLSKLSAYGDTILLLPKENGGQASAVNLGFKHCRGDIILFLDADDLLDPAVAGAVVKKFQDDHVVKVHWRLHGIDERGSPNKVIIPAGELVSGDLSGQLIALGPAHCGGPPESPPTSGNAWRRDFLEAVMPIPEEIFTGGIDFYLFVLAPLHGTISSLETPMGSYRMHGLNNTAGTTYRGKFFQRFEFCCEVLHTALSQRGIEKDPASWPRDHWFHQVQAALDDIDSVVPPGETFILIDDNAWVLGNEIDGRQRKYLMEKDGLYWGLPEHDQDATHSVQEFAEAGGRFLVLAPSSFWWKDHYQAFWEHVENTFEMVVNNAHVAIYKWKEDTLQLDTLMVPLEVELSDVELAGRSV